MVTDEKAKKIVLEIDEAKEIIQEIRKDLEKEAESKRKKEAESKRKKEAKEAKGKTKIEEEKGKKTQCFRARNGSAILDNKKLTHSGEIRGAQPPGDPEPTPVHFSSR